MDNKQIKPLSDFLKKIKFQDIVYSGVVIFLLLTIFVVFFFSAKFILGNINKIFSLETTEGVQALNIEQYNLAIKKLNIQTARIEEPMSTSTTSVVIVAPLPTIYDKQTITITVKNSTTKKGVASTLAKLLEDDGFQKPKTANEPKLYSTTTILLKEDVVSFGPVLLEAIKKSYPSAVIATTTIEDATDVIVIIGTN